MGWQEDTRTTLVGSPVLGTYDNPTVVDHLVEAVRTTFAEIDRLGIRNQVATVASEGDPTPPAAPATVLDDLLQQVTNRWAFPNGRARTLAQLAQQLENNVSALARADGHGNGGGGGDGTQGSVIWAPSKDFATVSGAIAAGYHRTQFESSDMNIHEGTSEIPIVDTSWGRAIKFTIPKKYVRAEAMPPEDLLNQHSSGVLYVGSWFALDTDFPRNPSKGWSVITQLHGHDTTSPRFSLQINHGEIRIGDTETVCPVAPSTRYDWVMRCDLDKGNVTVWVNGTTMLDGYHCGTSATPYYLKQGFYHSASDPGGTIFQGPLRVGTGYGAVVAR